MGEPLRGAPIARRIEQDVRREASSLSRAGIVPTLVAIQVGQHAASELYLRRQQQACSRLGVGYRLRSLPADLPEQELLRELSLLNRNPEVTGIILQMPLPEHINPRRARRAIHPDKDVEGVHPQNLGYLLSGRPAVVPCTAAAVMACLDAAGTELKGSEAVVVGHSEIVGKPVALLLMERLATVTVCHHETRDLEAHTRRAGVLVVAVGRPHLLGREHVREGAVIVDVGINEVRDGDRQVVVGDVDTGEVLPSSSLVTPVPGGVGPVTVAMLLANTVRAASTLGPLAM